MSSEGHSSSLAGHETALTDSAAPSGLPSDNPANRYPAVAEDNNLIDPRSGGGEGDGGAAPEQAVPAPSRKAPSSTRAGRAWVRVLPALVLLALILVFVFENLHDVKVSFFTASGRFPLALALFASAAAGALLVLAIGSVRILQLRRAVKRRAR